VGVPGVPVYKIKQPRLIQHTARCKANERYIENSNNYRECALKVSAKYGWYFSFGKVSSGPTPPPSPANFSAQDVLDTFKNSDDPKIKAAAHAADIAKTLMQVGSCNMLYNNKDSCPDGIETGVPYDFFALDLYKVLTVLIKKNTDCNAKGGEEYLGKKDTLAECAKAVALTPNGQFFIYGNGQAAGGFGGSFKGFAATGGCFVKRDTAYNCPDSSGTASRGFDSSGSHYDFYGLEYTKDMSAEEGATRRRRRRTGAGASTAGGWGADGTSQQDSYDIKIIKKEKECGSTDEYVGWYSSKEKCAAAVRKKEGKYFVYGNWQKSWLCYLEKTTSASCPEGFKSNEFDFYEIVEKGTTIPSASPITAIPTASPITAIPTASPITGIPTASPITGIPTNSPVTAWPSLSPITAWPTASPITEIATTPPSTPFPTTASPTATPGQTQTQRLV
jgi:hypothetical protein